MPPQPSQHIWFAPHVPASGPKPQTGPLAPASGAGQLWHKHSGQGNSVSRVSGQSAGQLTARQEAPPFPAHVPGPPSLE